MDDVSAAAVGLTTPTRSSVAEGVAAVVAFLDHSEVSAMRMLLVRAWMENPLACTMKRHTSEARRDAILATAARLWKGARPPRRGFRGSVSKVRWSSPTSLSSPPSEERGDLRGHRLLYR